MTEFRVCTPADLSTFRVDGEEVFYAPRCDTNLYPREVEKRLGVKR